MRPADREKRRIADDLEEPAAAARRLAEKLGLEPYDVNYWIVDNDEMNELIAYGGFQTRYPHWRWGMQYDRQRKQNRYLGGKAFEIVNNDDPAHAFLQESNTLADQKAVITHVEAHSDFFANNQWFGMFRDDPDAAAMLERHAETIGEHMADPDVERSEVEAFVDSVLCLEDNVDQHHVYEERPLDGDGDVDGPDVEETLEELGLSEEVSAAIFDEEWLDDNREEGETPTVPAEPEPDLLAFLREHGKRYDEDAEKAVEFEEWQVDVLDCLRREAYYFAPQKMTKVMNEGWACVAPDTLTFTEDGLIPMEDVVDSHVSVSDGDQKRRVYDSNVIPDHETVTVQTRRGFELTGSNNHRIRLPDGSWVRLDELSQGDEIAISGGNGVWPTEYAPVDWDNPTNTTLQDVADEAGVSLWTVMRYRETGQARKSEAIETALTEYDGENQSVAQRDPIRIPNEVTEDLGRFLGLLIGDGHVSVASKQVGFTTASREYAEEFATLATELFSIEPSLEEQGSRWRVYLYSANLVNFLREECDLPGGKSAAKKTIPSKILRSPKPVVAEFLTGSSTPTATLENRGQSSARRARN
ncbi:SpoVR family protein [Halospeciosus flavus]|uniref:SpoVR family protein n=1 Tax=Halospeciosus flavus TaxID=3032283 RepID=UPI003A8D129A